MTTQATHRGGWTPGKRRHRVDPVRLAAALDSVRGLLANPRRGEVSVRALAAHVGVSDRTVRRWLSGEDLPPAGAVRRVEAWVRRHSNDR
jgi:hypothetical protein